MLNYFRGEGRVRAGGATHPGGTVYLGIQELYKKNITYKHTLIIHLCCASCDIFTVQHFCCVILDIAQQRCRIAIISHSNYNLYLLKFRDTLATEMKRQKIIAENNIGADE